MGLKRQLQVRFGDSRDEGDWFFVSQALKDFIQGETRGHICELCAGETLEKQEELNNAANIAFAQAIGKIL